MILALTSSAPTRTHETSQEVHALAQPRASWSAGTAAGTILAGAVNEL